MRAWFAQLRVGSDPQGTQGVFLEKGVTPPGEAIVVSNSRFTRGESQTLAAEQLIDANRQGRCGGLSIHLANDRAA